MSIQVMDVTLRDGSFYNHFSLSSEDHKRLIRLLRSTGVDAVEIGYIGGLPPDHRSPSRPGTTWDVPLSLVTKVVNEGDSQIVCMLHPDRRQTVNLSMVSDIPGLLVRIPCRPSKVLPPEIEALAHTDVAVSVNLILGSWWTIDDLMEVGQACAARGATMVYIADTTSAFRPSDVKERILALRSATELPVGFHAHDGQGMAHANVEAALEAGATWIDGTTLGLGRGAGNARTEILLTSSTRDRYMSLLPEILDAFDYCDDQRIWNEVAGYFDLCPACMDEIEDLASELRMMPSSLALELLPGRSLPRPLTSEFLRSIVAETGL